MSDNELKQIQAWMGQARLPVTGQMEALYIHVPFCQRKCEYCDFYSEAGSVPAVQEQYVGAVLREAVLWGEQLGRERYNLRSVFLGGGTPTVLAAASMRQLLRGLRRSLPLDGVTEWTVEANPATVDEAYLAMLREEGVDRLSVGVQSFDDRDLRLLGRIHDAAAAEATLQQARGAGFTRLSVDLIYGVPGQTRQTWQANLARALSFGLTHLSCYGLTYEEGTPFSQREARGEVQRISEEEDLALFRLTGDFLETAGLHRYEISNFARPGEECRHNLLYWEGGNYLGLGPAAASHLEGVRWKTASDLSRWAGAVGAGRLVPEDCEQLSLLQRAGELAMLMLRTSRGLHCQNFERRLRIKPLSLFGMQFRRLLAEGLVEQTPDGVRLSSRGLEVADAVAGEFMA